MGKRTRRPPRLPVKQLVILAICRFAEPVALTSVFPYLPEMIESFNVPKDEVAKWAGLTSAVFSLSQCLTGIPWGRFSDRYGRKPVIMIGLTCTMVTSILFGFSQNLPWAICARALAGLSNGNVGIIRTTVAEMVPQKELQPRAFSIMPLVWTIGSIFGPAFGGALANPAVRHPKLFGRVKFFRRFPFALPNLVGSVFFLVGLSTGILFLHETLETKKNRKDYGLVLGQALKRLLLRRKPANPRWNLADGESAAPLMKPDTASDADPSSPVVRRKPSTHHYKPPSFREVFSRQSNINLAVYTMLAMHSVAFDQLLPIFMHHPTQDIEHNPRVHLPLKFAGGFGIDSSRIGMWFTLYGIVGMFIQFLIFPPVARKFGVLNCLKVCTLTFPMVYILTPFTSLFPTSATKQIFMFALMLVKCWAVIFAFPCSTILLTNSAASLRILGTLNGVATSVSAIGRAAGPALAGATFTLGVEAGYVIVPWWTLAIIAALGAVPVWWLVEMEGFGGAAEDSDSDSDSDDEYEAGDEGDSGPSTPRRLRATSYESLVPEEADESAVEDDYGPPLSPLNTKDAQYRPVTHLERRLSSPIGMGLDIGSDGEGSVGRGRRFSSSLGQTRSGYGAGGTTYQ